MAGMIISAAPMVLAYASGIPLQGSLNWGMNVMNGTDTKEGRTQQAQSIASENNAETSSQNESESQSSESIQQESGVQSSQSVTSEEKQQTETNDALEQEQTSQKKSRKTIGEYIKMVYKYGYAQLYGDTRAKWLLGFTLIAGILSVINWIITAVRFRKLPFELYFGITAASVIFMILYAAPFLGLPEIIAGARLCLTEQVLLLSMMALPADEVLFAIGRRKMAYILPYLSVLGVAAIYAGTNYFGVYHSYLYYELTRYNSVVNLTNRIASEYPKQRYTIISTTDEIYQVIESGWHEEILGFYYKSKLEKYYIPTEYLFFYVEKNPIQYAQYHFFAGPRWLAQKKYSQYYKYSNAVISEGSAIKSSKISEDVLGEPLTDMGKASDAYSNLKNRTILESELYFWCQDFKARLPYEIQVYYEDEDVVCYMIKQNPEHLYNLGSK